ncbi:hypothetical protein DVH05_005384 [Phytophthora capsici]|nr:hypothetical protein DVH05_005384 [Phytophthora capsici]
MFRPDFTPDNDVGTVPSAESGSFHGSTMSDVSSGHTEIIPSQSSPSDSHWSYDRNDDDDDPRYTEMRSNRSSSSGSLWNCASDGDDDESGDEENDDRPVQNEGILGGESEGYPVEGRQNDRLPDGLSDGVAVVAGSKSVTYLGYTYSFYHAGEETTNYRCSAYRRTGCSVKLYAS